MLTPWFAVSVGIVIATLLTLAAPHPALTFPPSKTGRCVQVGCGVLPAPQPGRHPTNDHEHPLRSQPASADQSTVSVEYAAQATHKGQFMAVIVIIGRHALKNWTLRFSWPGVQISTIWWAKLEHAGKYGVIVSGSPLPWPRSGANEARIVIVGTGTPDRPRGCVFDAAPCTFRSLTGETPKHGRWPVRR